MLIILCFLIYYASSVLACTKVFGGQRPSLCPRVSNALDFSNNYV